MPTKKPTPMGILLASLERRIDKFEKLLKSEQMSDKNRYVLKNIKKELESFRDGIKTKLLPMEEETIICLNCKRPALEHCYSEDGIKEVYISSMCEECFDEITKEEDQCPHEITHMGKCAGCGESLDYSE